MKIETFEERQARRNRLIRDAVRNNDPIPFTGNWAFNGFWRRPRLAQAVRAGCRSREEAEEGWKLRAKRNMSALSFVWDDFDRDRIRNWKKYRRHQWKEKKK